jgi:predicted N-acyltransferase
MADDRDELVAGALNLKSDTTLFGRNWGSLGRFRFLHFETCYYQAIDYAIAHGLKTVEAGAQGEHKIQRGYLPTATYSAHWIADAGFSHAIEDFLVRERRAMQHEIDALADYSPFKAGCEQS